MNQKQLEQIMKKIDELRDKTTDTEIIIRNTTRDFAVEYARLVARLGQAFQILMEIQGELNNLENEILDNYTEEGEECQSK